MDRNVNLNLNILTSSANKKRAGEYFNARELNIPPQVFVLNTNYLPNSL